MPSSNGVKQNKERRNKGSLGVSCKKEEQNARDGVDDRDYGYGQMLASCWASFWSSAKAMNPPPW